MDLLYELKLFISGEEGLSHILNKKSASMIPCTNKNFLGEIMKALVTDYI